MSIDEQFQQAKASVQALTSRPTDKQLLALYGLFKQATTGDVSGKRPGMLSPKKRYKYDAWAEQKGLSNDQAKEAYVALVKTLTA